MVEREHGLFIQRLQVALLRGQLAGRLILTGVIDWAFVEAFTGGVLVRTSGTAYPTPFQPDRNHIIRT